MKTCFIIMPITTPERYLDQYKGDSDHFIHVLDHLFKPAITAVGMEPIAPIVKGSEIIQGEIIKNIETADLVLCDMSILNPNVFFELGIRTALNKSVAMIKDDVSPKIPFDTGIINHHTYNSDGLTAWAVDAEIESLKTHLEDCMNNGQENALWGYFSMSQQAVVPKDAPVAEQPLSYIVKQIVPNAYRKPTVNEMFTAIPGIDLAKGALSINPKTQSNIPNALGIADKKK